MGVRRIINLISTSLYPPKRPPMNVHFFGERHPSNRLWSSGYIISCVGSCNYCKFPKWREDAKPKAYAMIDSLNWMNVNINLTEETIEKKIF